MSGNFRATGLEITGSADISTNLRVTGSAEISTNLSVAGNTTVSGDLVLTEFIKHDGDADTSIRFTNNSINLFAGNASTSLRVDTGNVIINEGGEAAIDFRTETDNLPGAILVDAGADTITLGTIATTFAGVNPAAKGSDVTIVLSGSAGSKDGNTGGAVLLTGDVVVSGSAYHSSDISLLQGSRLRFNNPGQNDIFVYANSDNALRIDGDDTVAFLADTGVSFTVNSNAISIENTKMAINTGAADADFYVNTSGGFGTFFIDGGDDTVIIGNERFDVTPAASEVSGYSADVKIMLSGSVGTRGTTNRGVVLMPGDVVVSGSLGIEGGLSGSLTQLVDGTSYLIAGANTTITSGSNGAITIASTGGAANAFSTFAVAGQSNVVADSETDTLTFVGAGGMTITTNAGSDTITFTSADTDTNTQNTLDQAYDEGGSGAGRTVTVDSGPVVFKEGSIGTGNTVLAVTGSAIFGNATSDSLYPTMPGPDTNFFVSGSIGSAGSNVKGAAAFGGDVTVTGSLTINTVTVTTDGKIGIGTTSPSHKLEVGGNASFGEYIYHRGDTDTFIQFADDAIGISAGNEQLVTISQVDAGQDIVKIGDGGDVDFQVRTNGDDNTLYVQGSSDRVGIGTNAPVSVLHVKEAAPTLSMQRENNGNDSTIAFLGSGGNTGAIMHLSSSNDLVFKTHDGSSPHEILRLGGHQASDVRQVIMLSGSGMGTGAMQPKEATDINFFASGSMMSKGTATRGTAVFGGDLVVSGGLHTGRIASVDDNTSFIDLTQNIIEINANHAISIHDAQPPGSDINFFVSGALDSKDTATKGTAVFGGDLVVSGTIFNSAGVSVGGKIQRHVKNNNFTLGNTNELFFPGSDGESPNGTLTVSTGFLAPYSGSLRKIAFRSQNSVTENVFRFYSFPGTLPGGVPGSETHLGHFSGSQVGNETKVYDLEKNQKRIKGGATSSLTVNGNFNFEPGDFITVSHETVNGSSPQKVNVILFFDYDTSSIIE